MFEYLKNIILILLIALPPWVALVSNMKKKKTKKQKQTLTIIFLLYIVVTIFTDNILPSILSVIYIIYICTNSKKSEEAYYFRPLKKKFYSFTFKGKKFNLIIAKERIRVIFQSIIFKILTLVATFWFIVFLSMIGIKAEDQVVVGEFLNASLLKSIYLIILMIITGPLLEEFIFRHIFYRLISNKIGKIFSAILTSVLFAFLHYNIAGIVVFFSLGLYNCYLYEKYGYRASLLNHFIFNLMSLLGLLFMRNLV